MSRKQRIVARIAGFIAFVITIAIWLIWDSFPAAIADELDGELQQVALQPHVDRQRVVITDPGDMEAIRAEVLAARRLSFASYPATTCSLSFNFADGRRVDLAISVTGLSHTNFFKQDPQTYRPLGYVILSWQGYRRMADSGPFLSALRKLDAVAAPDTAVDDARR